MTLDEWAERALEMQGGLDLRDYVIETQRVLIDRWTARVEELAGNALSPSENRFPTGCDSRVTEAS